MAIIKAVIAIASSLSSPELALEWVQAAEALTSDKILIYEIVQAKLGAYLMDSGASESCLTEWYQSRLNW